MATDRVAALERALIILDCFTQTDQAISLAGLAAKTGLYKSTILRLASSLQRYGYLRRDEDGDFRLGPTLWRLGSLYRQHFDLADAIRPALRQLVEATDETASFYVREGDARVCLYRRNSPRPTRHHVDEGLRLPLEVGAAGIVLLAFGGAQGAIYDAVRAAGHHVSRGERMPEVGSVAVPVLDIGGSLHGALAISAPIHRLDWPLVERGLAALIDAAARLREVLPVSP